MQQKDALYIVFWCAAAALGLYFLGMKEIAPFLFALSLVGLAFSEKMESSPYAAGSVFLALAFSTYFAKSLAFLTREFVAALLFLLLPFVLLEVRKAMSKK